MAYTSQENAVENTFVKAQDQINKMQKVFRDEGLLAKAVVDIGGNQDFGAIQEAFDNLYGALEDAHYDAIAHIEVESVKQKLGMNEEDKVMKVNKEIDLAGDSIWDKQGENPAKVMVMNITIENPYEPGGYMDDDEDDGYRKVDVEHDGPWSIYTDSGFEKAISEIVGFQVVFTEQGMQEDGMASLEGGSEGFGESKESVKEGKLTEGYESKVLKICKDEGIDCSFKDGKLHLDKADMAKAKKALKDDEDILELPDMVAESVAETNTDDDARKEQSPELTRLKQLIGIDTIREMKQ